MVKKNNSGETLISIIIGMFILSFVALSIIQIISYNKDIINAYQIKTDENILKQNTNNILKKIDLSGVKEGETFYINKNKTTKTFEVFTGTGNEAYKFVNALGDKVEDITSFDQKIYARDLYLSTNIVKEIAITTIVPSDIPNLLMHYDAQDTDGDGLLMDDDTNEPTDGSNLATWVNKSTGYPDAIATLNYPKYNLDVINTFPAISFDGTIKDYTIDNHADINSSGPYTNKSFVLVLKTGLDINTMQNIYEQGGTVNGYAFQIYNGDLYVGMWVGATKKPINLGAIKPNKEYYVIAVQSSSGVGFFKGYLNGQLITTLTSVPDQDTHSGGIGLGSVNNNSETVYNGVDTSVDNYFNGYIGEFISWNHALTDSEVLDIQKYIEEKWNMGQSSILDNVNISIIVKDINYTVPY